MATRTSFWLKRRINLLGILKKDVCGSACVNYKTLNNWLTDSTEPTLTARQWLGLAEALQVNPTELLEKFSKSSYKSR